MHNPSQVAQSVHRAGLQRIAAIAELYYKAGSRDAPRGRGRGESGRGDQVETAARPPRGCEGFPGRATALRGSASSRSHWRALNPRSFGGDTVHIGNSRQSRNPAILQKGYRISEIETILLPMSAVTFEISSSERLSLQRLIAPSFQLCVKLPYVSRSYRSTKCLQFALYLKETAMVKQTAKSCYSANKMSRSSLLVECKNELSALEDND